MKVEVTSRLPLSGTTHCTLKYLMPGDPRALYSIKSGQNEAKVLSVGFQCIEANYFKNNPSRVAACQRFIANYTWNKFPSANSNYGLWGWGRTQSGTVVLLNIKEGLEVIDNRKQKDLEKFRQFTAGIDHPLVEKIVEHRSKYFENLKSEFSQNIKSITGLDPNHQNPSFLNGVLPKEKFDKFAKQIARPNDFISKPDPAKKNFIDKKLENLTPSETLGLGAAAGCLATAAVLFTRKIPRGFSKFTGGTQINSHPVPYMLRTKGIILPPVLHTLSNYLPGQRFQIGSEPNPRASNSSLLKETISKHNWQEIVDSLPKDGFF
jgi:hypothetical protein